MEKAVLSGADDILGRSGTAGRSGTTGRIWGDQYRIFSGNWCSELNSFQPSRSAKIPASASRTFVPSFRERWLSAAREQPSGSKTTLNTALDPLD